MKKTVLLVDDNEDLLQIAGIILSGQGYTTAKATTVQEALERIKTYRPQVILLDVDLCGEDGQELCNRLKTDAQTNGIRVILMSGDDGSLNGNTEADDFLAKPFDFGELIGKVQNQFRLLPVA